MLAPKYPLFITFFTTAVLDNVVRLLIVDFYILRYIAIDGCGWGYLHAFCENNGKRIF